MTKLVRSETDDEQSDGQPSSVFRSLRRSLSPGNTMRPASEHSVFLDVLLICQTCSPARGFSRERERETRSLVKIYGGGGRKLGEKLRTRELSINFISSEATRHPASMHAASRPARVSLKPVAKYRAYPSSQRFILFENLFLERSLQLLSIETDFVAHLLLRGLRFLEFTLSVCTQSRKGRFVKDEISRKGETKFFFN